MRLEGKVALITGGANGMGEAEAKLFAREGAAVAIGDLREEDGQRVEAAIVAEGGRALFVSMDVTSEEDWRKAMDLIVTRFGKLDVLVNNAGISSRAYPDTDNASIEAWERIMAVNARGVFLGTTCAIPRMQQAGGRLHREHIFDLGPGGLGQGPSRLSRLQGGRSAVHQGDGGALRQGRNTGQLDAPRAHASHDLIHGVPGHRRAPGYPGPNPPGQAGQARGGGQCRPVSRLRRRVLYNGN